WDNAEEALPHMPTARATTAPVSIYDLVHAGSNQPTDSADEATYFMSTRPRRAHYWLLRWFPPVEPETCPGARFTFLAEVIPYAAGQFWRPTYLPPYCIVGPEVGYGYGPPGPSKKMRAALGRAIPEAAGAVCN